MSSYDFLFKYQKVLTENKMLINSRESMNMVTPAMQLASKIPDIHVQLWATGLLKGNTI